MSNNNFDFRNFSLKNFYKDGYTLDCTCMVSETDKIRLRNLLQIDKKEEILFLRDTSFWSERNQGCIITNQGFYIIPDNDHPNDIYFFPWAKIKEVKADSGNFIFCLTNDRDIVIEKKNFFKYDPVENGLSKLAEYFTNIAQSIEEVDVFQLCENKQYEEALKIVDEQIQRTDDCVAHYNKGLILCHLVTDEEDDEKAEKLADKYLDEAISEFDTAIEIEKKSNDGVPEIIYLKRGEAKGLYGRTQEARKDFILAYNSQDKDIQEAAKGNLDYMEKEAEESGFFENYRDLPYINRKFIMPIKDQKIGGCVAEGINTFRMSNLPNVKFPIGHPISGELYIGHPYNSKLYFPYENSEEIFFLDKIHELCYLLQCLGAEQISITSIKGKNVTEMNKSTLDTKGDANIKLLSGDLNYNKDASSIDETSSHQERTMKWLFDPTSRPFVPNELIWYAEQPQWQRLANSRLNGNMLEYHENVSTADTKFVSKHEQETIKASAKYLWTKLNGSSNSKVDSDLKENIETLWRVDVKFRSVKELTGENTEVKQLTQQSERSNQLTDNEQQYLDSIREFLEDNAEITPRERKMLDRIRTSLNISEGRAKELEELLTPKLTEDEQEYLDMYREYKEDGAISEKARRRLDKFAMALGISEERIKEIEAI